MPCCVGSSELPVGTVTGPRANAGSGGLEVCPWFAGELVTAGEGARVVPTAKNTSSSHILQLWPSYPVNAKKP